MLDQIRGTISDTDCTNTIINSNDKLISNYAKAGLRSIIVFDSYIQSKHTRIDLIGNTQITGANGKGKTSTLRLMQFFFTVKPDQATDRSKGTFINYYLPTTQSYIAYEYKQSRQHLPSDDDQIRTVIAFTNAAREGVFYRFFKGSYEQLINLPEYSSFFKETKSTYDTLKKLSALQPERFSRLINTTIEYSAILCNTKRYLNRNSSAARDAAVFSLPKLENELKCLNDLVLVMTDASGPYDCMKRMLINLYGLDHEIDGITREDDIPQVLSSIKTIKKVKAKRYKIDSAIEDFHLAKSLYTDLLFFHSKAKEFEEGFTTRLKEIDNHKVVVKQEITKLNADFASKHSDTSEKLGALEASIRVTEKNISRIKEKKEAFDKDLIVDKKAEFNNLAIVEQKLSANLKQIDRIQNQSKDIYADFERGKSHIEHESRCAVDELNKLKNLAHESLSETKDQYMLKISNLKAQKDKELKENETNAATPFKELQEKLGHAQMLLGESKANTPEEMVEINALEEEDLALARQIDVHREVLRNMRTDLREKIDNRDKALSVVEGVGQAISRLQQKLDNIRNLHFSDKTLLRSLRNQLDKETFVDAVKTIDKSLLPRTDIQVNKLDLNSNFFGLDINLKNVATPHEAQDTESIKEIIASLEVEISESKDLKKEHERDLAGANEAVNKAQLLIKKSENDIHQLEQSRNNVLQTKQELKVKFSLIINTRIEVATQKVESVKLEINEFNKRQLGLKKQIDDAYQNLEAHLKQELDEATSHHANNIKRFDHEISVENNTKNERIKELELARDSRLSKEGIDPKITQKIENDIRDAEKDIVRVKGYAPLIAAYDRFIEVEYLDINSHIEELHKFKMQKNDLNDELKSLKAIKDEQTRKLNEQLTQLNTEELTLEKNKKYVIVDKEKLERQIEPFDDIIPTKKTINSFEYFKEVVGTSLIKFNEISKNLKDLINTIENQLEEDIVGEVWRAWSKRREANRCHNNHTYFNVLMMEQLYEFMNNEFSHLENISVLQFSVIAEQMCGLYEKIKSHKDEVKKAAADIEQKIITKMVLKDVTSLDISIESTIDDQTGLYPELKKLKNLFNASTLKAVASNQSNEKSYFPDDSLIHAFDNAGKVIQKTNMASNKRGDLINLVIDLVELGNHRHVNSNSSFLGVSSQGMSRLFGLMIFTAMVGHINSDPDLTLHIPFDELGEIYPSNTALIIQSMIESNITLVTAQPVIDPQIRKFFENSWLIDTRTGLKRVVVDESRKMSLNPALAKLAQISTSQDKGVA